MTFEPKSVAILLFEDVELLDFAGPYEVFSSVHKPPERKLRLMDVVTVAATMAPVTCANGLVVQPDHDLENCPISDILLIPGGAGTRTAVNNPVIMDWLAQQAKFAELLTSVCTGSFLLAKLGVLNNKQATTHWAGISSLRKNHPAVNVQENVRWTADGNVYTSAGVSAGIDMALHIVQQIYGAEIANETARWIEYDYWPPTQ